jgi:holo-[acyl-carrier protein] synthase
LTLEIWNLITTGVDLVHIPRVEAALKRHGQRFVARVFTPREVTASHGFPHELAARFAAKEAVAKALGVGMRVMSPFGVKFHEVETLRDPLGKPVVVLSGRAAARAKELGLAEWAISLGHEREYAIAFVVAQ